MELLRTSHMTISLFRKRLLAENYFNEIKSSKKQSTEDQATCFAVRYIHTKSLYKISYFVYLVLSRHMGFFTYCYMTSIIGCETK